MKQKTSHTNKVKQHDLITLVNHVLAKWICWTENMCRTCIPDVPDVPKMLWRSNLLPNIKATWWADLSLHDSQATKLTPVQRTIQGKDAGCVSGGVWVSPSWLVLHRMTGDTWTWLWNVKVLLSLDSILRLTIKIHRRSMKHQSLLVQLKIKLFLIMHTLILLCLISSIWGINPKSFSNRKKLVVVGTSKKVPLLEHPANHIIQHRLQLKLSLQYFHLIQPPTRPLQRAFLP